MKLSKILNNPWIIFYYLAAKGVFNFLSDERYLRLLFRAKQGKRLDLDNPETYSEKLQWLKLYDRRPQYIQLVDKYEVKKYIAGAIGEEYLVPTIGVWDRFDDIDFNGLPSKFVLKCTHDSGSAVICTDKNGLDIAKAKSKIERCLGRNYFFGGREWPYKNVAHRIICEAYISETGDPPKDFKVLCFEGKAKLIQVHTDRFSNHKMNFYDMEWNKLTIAQKDMISDFDCEKPDQFDEMIRLSEQLASQIPHVRVDWFIEGGKLYFGEMTLYDGSGFDVFDNEEDDYLLGSWIELPVKGS